MNIHIRSSLVVFAFLINACAHQNEPMLTQQISTQNERKREHQLLVTFTDSGINRSEQGDPANLYQQRGTYQSTQWAANTAESIAQDHQLLQVNEWPMTSLGIHCVVYQVQNGQTVETVIEKLTQDHRVEKVQKMHTFKVLGNRSYNDPYAKLQTSALAIQTFIAHRWSTGKNIEIAVIDTGIETHHPDLIGQVIKSYDFTQREEQLSATADLHGTAVAGIIAAKADNNQGIVGVAPNAKLIALQACWSTRKTSAEANCDTLTLALALNRAIELKPHILNLSLTGPQDDILKQLIDKAIASGIVVITAQSQENPEQNNFPSSIPGVITVGLAQPLTLNISQQMKRDFLLAPGNNILTTLPTGSYDYMTGSSFSAAHVSGIVALLLEINPKLTHNQLFLLLKSAMSNASLTESELPSMSVNACAALAQLISQPCDKITRNKRNSFLSIN